MPHERSPHPDCPPREQYAGRELPRLSPGGTFVVDAVSGLLDHRRRTTAAKLSGASARDAGLFGPPRQEVPAGVTGPADVGRGNPDHRAALPFQDRSRPDRGARPDDPVSQGRPQGSGHRPSAESARADRALRAQAVQRAGHRGRRGPAPPWSDAHVPARGRRRGDRHQPDQPAGPGAALGLLDLGPAGGVPERGAGHRPEAQSPRRGRPDRGAALAPPGE
jgi:hypothetical protein